jgi:hypothetical protein
MLAGFIETWNFSYRGSYSLLCHQRILAVKSNYTCYVNPKLMVADVIPGVGLFLTEDKLIATVAQVSGSIWVLDNLDR